MAPNPPGRPSDEAGEPAVAVVAVVLAALGAWTIGVPYLGHAVGFGVDVASSVEVVDHVVPGIVVLLAGSYLFLRTRRGPVLGRRPGLIAAGAAFLAGFWILATHVPLLIDAGHGREPWGSALWHASSSVAIIALSLWCVLRAPLGEAESPG